MTKQKDLKRIVRSRMTKTGESYTAARLQVTRKKGPDYETLAGMSDAALAKATGRAWADWVKLLDEADAASKPHREIAIEARRLGAGDWWAQSVSVGYERIRGLRAIGQRRGGKWEASRSRTFPVPVETLFDAFSKAARRSRWLGKTKLQVRKETRPKSIRITWDDQTSVELYFTPKGAAKSSVAVQHTKLDSKESADRMKSWWSERLDALGEYLSK
jgi:hypothetical protein